MTSEVIVTWKQLTLAACQIPSGVGFAPWELPESSFSANRLLESGQGFSQRTMGCLAPDSGTETHKV